MRFSAKTMATSVLVALIVGFLLGFVPQYRKNSAMMQSNESLQSELGKTQARMAISGFTSRSALVYVEAEKHNFSVASESASSLFTDLRKYSDQVPDKNSKQQLEQILYLRDHIIAGLATADPAVVQQLQELFLKMQSIQASGN